MRTIRTLDTIRADALEAEHGLGYASRRTLDAIERRFLRQPDPRAMRLSLAVDERRA